MAGNTALPVELAILLLRVEHETIMHSDADDTSVGEDDISESAKLMGDSNESFAYGSSLFSSELPSSSPRMQSTE